VAGTAACSRSGEAEIMTVHLLHVCASSPPAKSCNAGEHLPHCIDNNAFRMVISRQSGAMGLTISRQNDSGDATQSCSRQPIWNATRPLSDADVRIIDVAFSSGSTDPAHFTRAFQRISGTTPRQFRVQQRAR